MLQRTVQGRTSGSVTPVVAVVREKPGLSGNQINKALRDAKVPFQNGDEKAAAERAVQWRHLRSEKGPRNATHYFPVETAQRPMFRLLGTPPDKKRQVISEGGHFVPRTQLVKETLDWLDRYLGPVQ